MEEKPHEIDKQKNSRLTVILILINLFLGMCFLIATVKDKQEENMVFLAIGFLAMLGGYAFTYNGKNYRLGKWIFGIAIFIGLVFFGLLWYVTQLGKAYSH